MSLITYLRDNTKFCPCCGVDRNLVFITIKEPSLQHKGPEREDITTYYPDLREYKCRNCDAEFLLLSDGDNP